MVKTCLYLPRLPRSTEFMPKGSFLFWGVPLFSLLTAAAIGPSFLTSAVWSKILKTTKEKGRKQKKDEIRKIEMHCDVNLINKNEI